MAKGDKQDVAKAKSAAAGKVKISNPKAFNKASKAGAKTGTNFMNMKATSSGYKLAKTNSATKPSMPVKTGAKNKMKAQGGKIGSSATSGYGKTTKKK